MIKSVKLVKIRFYFEIIEFDGILMMTQFIVYKYIIFFFYTIFNFDT